MVLLISMSRILALQLPMLACTPFSPNMELYFLARWLRKMAKVRALDSCNLILRTLPFMLYLLCINLFLRESSYMCPSLYRRVRGRMHVKNQILQSLYVKYLSEDVTEDVLRERFSEYGNIFSVVIMKDSVGVSKGFGFVGFNLHEDGKKAMEALNSAIIDQISCM
ncbi:polyadenylate-binding protein 2-like [Apium graveolens]|uniref:polyadenylate-binding protein 2-like n=1 Tax=Apium graveolens TaxID=4045 RepID=UPI003D79B62C